MPDRNTINAQQLLKGDVIWVPYRKDPLWPALVNNVYPKKVSYSFFPLSPGDNEPKKSRFSCAPKLTYAFVTTEPLPRNSEESLKEAYTAACEYLSRKGKTRGADIQTFEEAGKEQKATVNKKIKQAVNDKKPKKRVRKETDTESDDDDIKMPHLKKAASSSSDRSSPFVLKQLPQITDEQSESMMELIDERLNTLVEEIWQNVEVVECQKQSMANRMSIKLKNNQFLKETDYEAVFERVVILLRSKNTSISLISAFNITASHIVPHVLISCYSALKKVNYQAAKDIYHHENTRVLGLDPSMSIPVTDHLEELCRLACNESDAIRK